MAPKLKKPTLKKEASSPSGRARASGGGATALDLSAFSPQKFTTQRKNSAWDRPGNAEVSLYVWKYTQDCRDFLPEVEGMSPLWLVRLVHEANPSFVDGLLDAMKQYLEKHHAVDADLPADLTALAESGVIVEFTKTKSQHGQELANPQGAPFQHWALAFWVTTDLKDFFVWLEDFMFFRATNQSVGCDKKPWPAAGSLQATIYPAVPVALEGLAEVLGYRRFEKVVVRRSSSTKCRV